jgi:hypothetical protein
MSNTQPIGDESPDSVIGDESPDSVIGDESPVDPHH